MKWTDAMWWDASAPYIKAFSGQHLAMIAVLVVCIVLVVMNKMWVRAHRTGLARVLLGLSVAQIVLLYSWYAIETGFDVSQALPLHISRITAILGACWLATKSVRNPSQRLLGASDRLMNVQFYWAQWAWFTFLIPAQIHPLTHVLGWSFLVNHVITLLLPILAVVAYGWRPSKRSLLTACAWFTLYFAVVLVVNQLVGGNYFYLTNRPLLKNLPDAVYVPLALLAGYVLYWLSGAITTRFVTRPERGTVDDFVATTDDQSAMGQGTRA